MRATFSPSSPHRAELLARRAHAMRHTPTDSEARLFQALRAHKLGVAFRRQVVVASGHIIDLLAPALGLAVEIDGPYHARRRRADARRDRALQRLGFHVLHLDAELVIRNLPLVVARVKEAIERLAR